MKAISRKSSRGGAKVVVFFVALVFCAVGSVLFYFLSALPLQGWMDARQWASVPCTIVRSDVDSHHSDDGTTYSVDIAYRYTWDGETYTGEAYNFFSGSSSGRSYKEAIVNEYPVDSTRECFVNPENPGEAVLNRDFNFTYLIGVFGLIFVFGGLGMFVYVFRKQEGFAVTSSEKHWPTMSRSPELPDGTITLKGSQNRVVTCGCVFVIAAFWNSIVGTMLVGMYADGDFGSGEFLPFLFLIPFVLVGLGMIAFLIYSFLAIFNPQPDLTLSPGYLPLGGTAVLGWTFRGNASRIHRLTFTLIGEEKATYRRGTSTTTDSSTFANVTLFETELPQEMAMGEIEFTMPEFTVPSFDAPNNKIVWSLKVHGDIRRWPDINAYFPITVSPLPRDTAAERLPAQFRED